MLELSFNKKIVLFVCVIIILYISYTLYNDKYDEGFNNELESTETTLMVKPTRTTLMVKPTETTEMIRPLRSLHTTWFKPTSKIITYNEAIFEQTQNEKCDRMTNAPSGITLGEILNKCAVEQNLGGSGKCVGIQQNTDGTYSGCLSTSIDNNNKFSPNTSWILKNPPIKPENIINQNSYLEIPIGSRSIRSVSTKNGSSYDKISNIRCNSFTGPPSGKNLNNVLNNCSETNNLGGSGKPCVGIIDNGSRRKDRFYGCLDYHIDNRMPNTSWIRTRDKST